MVETGERWTPDASLAQVGCDGVNIWSQATNSNNALASLIDTGIEGADANCVDDFISPGDNVLTCVKWTGGITSGGQPLEFVITFYRALESCDDPDPGLIIHQQTVTDFNIAHIAGIFYSYSAALDNVPMDTGARYWLSIRAVKDVSQEGWWGWAVSSADWGLCAPRRICLNLGWPDWTLLHDIYGGAYAYRAFAFELFADPTVTTEPLSWGEVKDLYQ